MASFAIPFSSLVHMRTSHSAMKHNYCSRRLMCVETGRVFVIHDCCRLGAWTEPGQWFFNQYCIYLL